MLVISSNDLLSTIFLRHHAGHTHILHLGCWFLLSLFTLYISHSPVFFFFFLFCLNSPHRSKSQSMRHICMPYVRKDECLFQTAVEQDTGQEEIILHRFTHDATGCQVQLLTWMIHCKKINVVSDDSCLERKHKQLNSLELC